MAGPIAAFIQLPTDSGNTGKKNRTQTRVIGSDTVHEHFVVPAREAQVLGVYRLGMAQQTVSATVQNGTSSGYLWAHVPTAVTGKKSRMRKIRVESQHGSVLATPTAPRLAVSRFTFTGTASGASVALVKHKSGYPASVFDLRTAATGLTVTLVGVLGSIGLTQALTAVGINVPSAIEFIDSQSEDDWPEFAPGEGAVLWQDVAGTASDTRRININIVSDDIDTA